MLEGLYGNLLKKPIIRPFEKGELPPIETFLSYDELDVDQKVVIKSYVRELKNLLNLNSAIELIEGVNHIQAMTNKLQEKFPAMDLPSFYEFYQELSPLLLQKYWERASNSETSESLESVFLESIHIALEEEIYIWQEKIN